MSCPLDLAKESLAVMMRRDESFSIQRKDPWAPTAYVADMMPCQASVGEEALGSVKARCPSIWECQGLEAGVGEWLGEHPQRSIGVGE